MVSVGRIWELSPRVWGGGEVTGEEELDGPLVYSVMGFAVVMLLMFGKAHEADAGICRSGRRRVGQALGLLERFN